VVIVLGLFLVLGGGVLGLCGSAAGNGGGMLILIGILPIALGGYLIMLALGYWSGKRQAAEGEADDAEGLH
jgi:hypothetical protein